MGSLSKKDIVEFATITAIIIVAFTVYIVKEFSTPLLYGIDGPYYYIQVSSILKCGHLKYPDPPLAFYILTCFSIILGDVTIGIKVGSVLVTLIAAYAVYYLVRKVTRTIGGLVAVLIFVFSPMLVRLSFDLIKNAMGLTFLLFTVLFYYLSLKRRSFVLSILSAYFIVLTGLTHVLDFAVAYIVISLTSLTLINKRTDLKLTITPFLFGSTLLILGFLNPYIMGGDPYKGISFIRSLINNRAFMSNVLELSKVIFPALLGIAGFITSIKLKNAIDKRLLLTLSIILILLNLPIYPQQFLWRFNLMTVVFAPIILGVIVGGMKDLKVGLVLSLVVLGFVLPQFTSQIYMVKPSISLGEYYEIKQLVSKMPKDTVLVVPNTKLRYWIETLTSKVAKSVKDVPPRSRIIIVLEKTLKHKRPLPPITKPFYNGLFISAYLLPPKPLRP